MRHLPERVPDHGSGPQIFWTRGSGGNAARRCQDNGFKGTGSIARAGALVVYSHGGPDDARRGTGIMGPVRYSFAVAVLFDAGCDSAGGAAEPGTECIPRRSDGLSVHAALANTVLLRADDFCRDC